ncbi:MAG: hypothetical protein E7573_07450 [Ruminococcaceae bacterium]|nr:hypothetical protein [Oscillospiraceae bacterium]MBR3598097.1 hypothetical protein [Clostridia bacterium]
MLYPELRKVKEKISRTDVFTGIKATGRISEGKFRDMVNISFDEFPCMRTRRKRAIWTGRTSLESGAVDYNGGEHIYYGKGILEAVSVAGKFLFCSEKYLYVDGKRLGDIELDRSVEKRSIIGFGRNLLVLPEGVYIEFSDDGKYKYTDMHSEIVFSDVSVSFCNSAYEDVTVKNKYLPPLVPSVGDTYIRKENGEMYLWEYTSGGTWEKNGRLYVNIRAEGIGEGFYVGEKISIADDIFSAEKGSVVDASDDRITVDIILDEASSEHGELKFRKYFPLMDFAVEHNNRIWGCRYGEDIDGNFVNEIYACAPGNPLKWYCYEGTSMDSFAATLGCSGEFTGACVLGNDVLFFKEDYLIRVSGDSPATFSVQTVPFQGVEKGSSKSIVRIADRLFYKGREGICVFDGSSQMVISRSLGDGKFSDVIAGAVNGKYYAAMTDGNGKRSIYVFDSAVSYWSKENCADIRYMINMGGCLFFVELTERVDDYANLYRFVLWDEKKKNDAPDILGAFLENSDHVYVSEDSVSWFVETGEIGENTLPERQILRSILITASLVDESDIKIFILPEGETEWISLGIISSARNGAFSVPVNTPPCHSYIIRIEGQGECMIHSIVRRSEITSEVKNIGRR